MIGTKMKSSLLDQTGTKTQKSFADEKDAEGQFIF